MKKLRYFIIIMLFSNVCLSSCKKNDDSPLVIEKNDVSSVALEISKIKNIEGVIHFALCNSKADWDNDIVSNSSGSEYKIIKTKVIDNTQQVKFDTLSVGTSAISMYQDENEDGTLNRTPDILPAEPYGLLKNAKPSIRGVPQFDDSKFEVSEMENVILGIELVGS